MQSEPGMEEQIATQLLKDSLYYYYKQYSLWNETPEIRNDIEQTFTKTSESVAEVLEILKKQTPFYAAYGGAIDRFSHLEYLDSPRSQSSFGLFITIGIVSSDRAYPVVYLVEGGSPAAEAGIRRSDIITGVNGNQDLSIPVLCQSGSCSIKDQTKYQSVLNNLLQAMSQASISINLRRRDDREARLKLSASAYSTNPIIKDSVFAYPTRHLGYLALASFEEIPESSANRQRLNGIFETFRQQQINDLIVDLRYNTGGAIEMAEYIANKVAGANAEDALMYRFALNPYLSKHKIPGKPSFDDVHFQVKDPLNLNTVYFLVSDVTASASELLINVLRPYMRTVIIAEHESTYGKPVGFLKQEIMGKIALWTASFKLINARGETDYWSGIGADVRNISDDISRDFGDPQEAMLSTAISIALGKQNTQLSTTKEKLKDINVLRERNLSL